MKLSPFLRCGRIFAGALIGISLLVFAGIGMLGDGAKVGLAIGRISPELVAVTIALALVNYLMRAIRFQIFAHRLGIFVPTLWMGLYYVAGFAMSATPGKLGELLRLWLIRRQYGYGIERGLPLQIADRTSDVVASIILCIAGLGAFSGYLGAVLSGAAVVAIGIVLLINPRFLLKMIGFGYRLLGRRGRLFVRARNMVRATSRLFDPRIFAPTLVLAIIGWGAECLALDRCMETIAGVGGDLARATFIFTFANLAGGLTLLPGGIGGTEVTIAGLLISSGIEFEAATITTAVIRLATLWFGILVGALATAILLKRSSNDKSAIHTGIEPLEAASRDG